MERARNVMDSEARIHPRCTWVAPRAGQLLGKLPRALNPTGVQAGHSGPLQKSEWVTPRVEHIPSTDRVRGGERDWAETEGLEEDSFPVE